MYTTSQNYKNYIKEPSRMFESKIILGSRTLNNDDVIQLKTELQQPSNGFTLGSCISKSLELTLKNDGGTYASAGVLDVSIGLKMGELIEYIPQGLFNIDTVEKTDYTVKITAYDNMIKFETAYSEKYDNPTLKQVIQQLQTITGVEFDSSVTIPSYTLSKLSGYTCREILSYVASLMGGNAYITRDGKFTIVTPVEVDYTVTADNYFDYDIEDNTYKIGMLTCQNKLKSDAVDESDDYEAIEEKNTISAGSLGTDNMELTFINPWMTETILNSIYNKLKTFSFLGYSMKWQGDLSIDVGNIINVTDRHGVTRKALVFSDKINYNGGLTQETGAKGQTKSSNEFSTIESPTKLDRISVKLLLAEKAIIQKANINDLTAVSAKVGTLDASIANINTALINYAKVDDLNATNANISNLNAQYANLSSAIINKADIAELNAANVNISNLQATVADISTLVSGNLTSANIHSLVLTADKVTVQNGFIKNAMVESLVADKITSGTLNTNKLTISSNDGGLVMSNSTIQFSDKDKNVRVQIGQDAKGDFNFIVKGADGKTVLLDSTGLHEGAISDGLIKTDMIADNSINSNKIDYSSVINGLNADGSNYINASKVAIDLTGQSLDVAFNSVKSTADSANDKIDNLSVGGRNYIKNSIFANGETYWNQVYSVSSIDKAFLFNNHATLKLSASGLTSDKWSGVTQRLNIDVAQGKTYTLSCYYYVQDLSTFDSALAFEVKAKREGLSDVSIGRAYIQKDSLIEGEWTKITKTVTINRTDLNNPFVYVWLQRNGTAWFTNFKLEEGTISTDWAPAPEDVENSILDVKTITETNTTSISSIQGQISTLISNTTVIVDGKEKTLKDAYSSTVQTVNSINTTIGEHTNTLNTLNGTVSSNSSKITSIQTDLNGVKTSVSSVQSDLNSTKSQLSSLSSTLDGFESRVEATESNLSNLKIGGRNLIIYSDNGYLDDLKVYQGSGITYSNNNGWRRMLLTSQLGNMEIVHNKYVALEETGDYTESIYVKTDGIITKSKFSFFTYYGHAYVDSTIKDCGNNLYRIYGTYKVTDIDKMNIRVVDMIMTTQNATYLEFRYPQFEKGNTPTSWTPAPEDAQTYTDSQISNAKSEIKQTTDSISQSITSINSSITTINNTLVNKAEKSIVESISSSLTTLETSVSGITGRVSSLETNTTTLTTTLNNLQVGGRNLLQDSSFPKNTKKWTIRTPNISIDETVKHNANNSIKMVNSSRDRLDIPNNYFAPYIKGTKLILTVWIMCPDVSKITTNMDCWIGYRDENGNATGNNAKPISPDVFIEVGNNKWFKWTITGFMANDSSTRCTFMCATNNSDATIYVSSPKLEEGNMATDWTPAPEDIDNSITTVQETVTSNTTEISALKNSISLKVDSTEMTSYKETVNGQLNTINSNISSMQSSIDLQLDSIKSSVSKTVSTKNLINNSAFNKPLGTYSANGTVKMCEIVPKSTYTSWGNATPPVASDNVLIVRFDVGGDNYVHFKDIFAKVKPSTTYTFSYYCSSSGNITGPSSHLYERTASQSNQIVYTNAISIGPDTASIGKGWVRKITSFTTRSDTDSVMVRFGFHSTDGATRMLIAGLQLEEGSQATDWVEGNTSSVGTIITQSPTEVMTAFNGISQYFEVSASGAKFGNISTGDYMAFNDRGLVRYIANQEKRYIYMVQPRTFTKTLNNQTPALTSAQSSVGKTNNWDNIKNNMPKAKDYAQTFTLTFDNELINLLAGYAPQYATKLSTGFTNPSNLSYSGLSSGSQDGVVGEDYITDTYIEVVSMTSTSITFKAAKICCVYEVTVDKTGLIKYYQYKRNYAGGAMTWNGLLFA